MGSLSLVWSIWHLYYKKLILFHRGIKKHNTEFLLSDSKTWFTFLCPLWDDVTDKFRWSPLFNIYSPTWLVLSPWSLFDPWTRFLFLWLLVFTSVGWVTTRVWQRLCLYCFFSYLNYSSERALSFSKALVDMQIALNNRIQRDRYRLR